MSRQPAETYPVAQAQPSRHRVVGGQPELPRTLVVIPAYNEDRFVGSLVLKLLTREYRVVVIDDGSSDQTGDIAEAAGATVIRHSVNRGKAEAVRTAFEYARTANVDALVLLDGDSQHDPADVERLAEPVLADQADMVVGSRFLGTVSRIPRWRVVGQHALTLATNIGSGLAVSDSQSGFRAFSRRAIESMALKRGGFSVESEMQFQSKALGLRVLEVPIHVLYEDPAKRSAIRQGLSVLDGVLRLIAENRPLLFFTVPGAILFLAGVVIGFAVIRIYEATLVLAVGYALVTVLFSVVGTLAMFFGVMLHTLSALLARHADLKGGREQTR